MRTILLLCMESQPKTRHQIRHEFTLRKAITLIGATTLRAGDQPSWLSATERCLYSLMTGYPKAFHKIRYQQIRKSDDKRESSVRVAEL